MAPLYALVLFLYCFSGEQCSAIDTITATQSLQDSQAIISKNGTFKLGFFSPPNSANRYVGIWFNKASVMNVVWVANRDKPITDSSGVLKISENGGNLQILNGQKKSIWSSQVLNLTVTNTSAQLLDSGNFVLLQANTTEAKSMGKIIWQSFDHPTNTFLPGMKPTVPNTPNKENFMFKSWKTPSDPSEGSFSIGIGTNGLPQLFCWNNNGIPHWRSGPWDGNIFIGIGNIDNTLADGFALEDDPESGTLGISFSPVDESLLFNYVVESGGTIIEQYWDNVNKNWTVGYSAPSSVCDVYGTCGVFGICNHVKSPICRCLKGFQPKNQEWKKGNWSSGCVRRTPLQCGTQGGQQDGFLRLQLMKAPDEINVISAFSQDGCRSTCLNNCSCAAYAYHLNIGCMTWNKDLIDLQEFSIGGVDLFVRLPSSELGKMVFLHLS